jgi:two-component system, chemotaxis family, CheB/CheR fusion protein
MKEENEDLNLVFNTILENVLAGYWDWNVRDNTQYMSLTFKNMFGYQDHELPNVPESWQKIIHPDDLPGVFQVFDTHVKSHGEIPYNNEVRYFHKDGSIVWVLCQGKVVEWGPNGEPIRMIGVHVDVTRQKQMEETLKKEKQRLEMANQMMIERELEMVELKKEVNALLEQSGQKPKYD